MTNAMKKILVSRVKAQVDDKTFVERIAYLLDDDTVKLLCNGIPKEILSYDIDKMKPFLQSQVFSEDKNIEVNNVELTSNASFPVRVSYTSTVIRYFASEQDAKKAEKFAKLGHRDLGKDSPSKFYHVGQVFHYPHTSSLPAYVTDDCVTFKRF